MSVGREREREGGGGGEGREREGGLEGGEEREKRSQ